MRKVLIYVALGLLFALTPSALLAEEAQSLDPSDFYNRLIISKLSGQNGGQEIFLRKEGNKWTLLKPGQRPSLQDEGTEKLVYQDPVVYLGTKFSYRDCRWTEANGIESCACSSSDGDSRKKAGYHFCTSSFKRAKANSLKEGMSRNQGNLIVGALDAAFVSLYEIDVEGIRAALREAGFDQFLQEVRDMERRQRYRNEFAAAASSADLSMFISKYQANDPDKLVPMAMKKKEAALASENEEKQRLMDEKAREARELALFRKRLDNGDETNCGPVIESKGALVKVYFPVANYGNEHWVRKSLLYPAGYGCRFVNGGYVPPM